MTTAQSELRRAVAAATPRLERIADADAARPRAPGKWSRKEIIGHLIDSASINHERFVRAQLTDDLVCRTYDQEMWVKMQRYADAPWSELVSLWSLLNLHIARVMEAVPVEARMHVRTRHNLHQVAFHAVPSIQPASLDYFMRDYVSHLEHHLAQIFE
jgi:hypothetical protein